MGTQVRAAVEGTVVLVEPFTGAHVLADPTPHWNDTWAVLVEGKHGDREVFVYGEIAPLPHIQVGYQLLAGEPIGHVVPVLRKNKGRPMCMLHFEVMRHGSRETLWWKRDQPRPDGLIDATYTLIRACVGRYTSFWLDTWDRTRFIDPNAPVVTT